MSYNELDDLVKRLFEAGIGVEIPEDERSQNGAPTLSILLFDAMTTVIAMRQRAEAAEAREAALLAGNHAVWDDGYRIAGEMDALRAENKRLRQQVAAAEAAALELAAQVCADWEPMEKLLPLCDDFGNACAITGQHEAAERLSTAIRAMITPDAAAALEAVKEDARMEAVKVTPQPDAELDALVHSIIDDVRLMMTGRTSLLGKIERTAYAIRAAMDEKGDAE